MPRKDREHPTVFISYSWDSENHRAWVLNLATRLRSDGVDVTLDQWHTVPGDQLPEFMERAIRENEFILIICTPKYKSKSEQRSGGVGYEGDIMTAEVFVHGNHRKFVPVLREGPWLDAAPSWMLGKYYIDLQGDSYSETAYLALLSSMYDNHPHPPDLGAAHPHGARRLNLLQDLEAPDRIKMQSRQEEKPDGTGE